MLDKNDWEVINFVEQHWLKKGVFPGLRTISNNTNLSQVDVSSILKSETVQKSLDARGIEWQPVSSDTLKPEQIACIQVLLDISDRRTIGEKLKSLGIPQGTYYGWKKSKKFLEAYREASEALYGEALPEVHRSLIQEAVNGSFVHQKLMLAISGRWDEKKQAEQMNVKFVLMKVLEIIQTHVSDPETLQAIAGEFESILSPEPKAITAQAQPINED
jgi:hypothetical protein